jgi:hypothetical protein
MLGRPNYNAIIWQDTRTNRIASALPGDACRTNRFPTRLTGRELHCLIELTHYPPYPRVAGCSRALTPRYRWSREAL